jgi:hypothetical protein
MGTDYKPLSPASRIALCLFSLAAAVALTVGMAHLSQPPILF